MTENKEVLTIKRKISDSGFLSVALEIVGSSDDLLDNSEILYSNIKGKEWLYNPESITAYQNAEEVASATCSKGFDASGSIFRIEDPKVWKNLGKSGRSERYMMQSWLILDALLLSDSKEKKDIFYRKALNFSILWIDTFLGDNEIEDEFAWYDMAVGQRSTKLSYLLKRALVNNEPEQIIARLLVAIYVHRVELMCEERMALHSNHGLFQMLGLASIVHDFPILDRGGAAKELVQNNIASMLQKHFLKDGMHGEHSPEYHVYMANYLNILLASGYFEGGLVERLSKKVMYCAQFIVDPMGYLLPHGDTQHSMPILKKANFDISSRSGEVMPPEGFRWFPDFGLVVDYGYEDGSPCWLLSFMAAFHSRQHKHADDMGFNLYVDGRPLLIEAGGFQYEYASPERVYCETTRAHNCLEIDGLNYSRFNSDRFGSAIMHAEKIGSCTYIDSFVRRRKLIGDLPFNEVRQTDSIPVDIEHRRIVLYRSGDFLLVVDLLNSASEHFYKQWFNCAEHVAVLENKGKRLVLTTDGGRPRCVINSLIDESSDFEIHEGEKGEAEKQMNGWIAEDRKTLIPRKSISIETKARNAVMATLIDLLPRDSRKFAFRSGTNGKYLRFVISRGADCVDFRYRRKGSVLIDLDEVGEKRSLVY